MAQAHALAATLTEAGHEVEIVPVRTSGDRGNREVLGAFVKEIQEALLRNDVDVALHCLKDLPTRPVEGLTLAAYLPRDFPNDALISRGPTFEELPEGAVVGTGSLRRTSQMAATRPDLVFRPLMGNIDTRMRRLMAGEYDAIILAITGLRRLGLLDASEDVWTGDEYPGLTVHRLEPRPGGMVPAPGQAVLVLETRADDAAAIAAVHPLHHPWTQRCADAERDFLHAFGGGCSVPVGAYATEVEGRLELTGLVASPDGRTVLTGTRRDASGAALAQELGAQGAFEIVNRVLRDRDGGGEH